MTDRITVGLTPKASEQLGDLHVQTSMTKTDIVNRAISLYAFFEEQRQEGHSLAVFDPEKGEFQSVHVS